MNLLKIILILILFSPAKSAIAGNSKSQKNSKSPTEIITKITSDFIDIKRPSETVNLTGNVVVERQDASMTSDFAKIYYSEAKKGQDGAIKKIEATDNVKIFNGQLFATGKKGFYYSASNKFVIKENVVFNNGGSISHGEEFVYDLKTKKGNLVGTKNTPDKNGRVKDGRVIVIINDSDTDKSDSDTGKSK